MRGAAGKVEQIVPWSAGTETESGGYGGSAGSWCSAGRL